MKFTLGLRIDDGISHQSHLVHDFEKKINIYFDQRYYGKDVLELMMEMIIVKVPVGYEHLFKIKKPVYIDHKVIKNSHTNEPIELNKVFLFDVKFDNEECDLFLAASDANATEMLGSKILHSLANLDLLPKKVKDFNKSLLIQDFEKFLQTTMI